jgi:ATP-binding cassette subfamily B protein
LLKFFNINSGTITVSGKNIDVDTLRNDTTLFHKTIFENIAYGKQNVTLEEVIDAAKKSHIHETIINLEHGYDTQVGERGGKLSGGQKQRIIIARAILKNSPILILDEATSALDSRTESDIQESLNYLMQGKTVISIAHKLNTIKNMDRIIEIENGKIIKEYKN